jgi:hypothetical protein
MEAMIQKISKAVGFFLVPDPNMGTPSSGTGTLVQWQGTKYFVSALHCFFHDSGGDDQVIRSWNATRFAFPSARQFGRTESLHEAEQRVEPEIGRTIPVHAREDFFIDSRHDLIAVRVPSALIDAPHLEYVNLETEAFTKELAEGVSLLVLGAPIASRVNVPGFGQTLIPQVDHVRYDPHIDISGLGIDFYSQSYFYFPYSLTQEGIDPHGFSGAAVFVTKKSEPDGIWSVSPQMVGIVQQFGRSRGCLAARKISTVIDLLNTGEKTD